jgi:hypothetical protein
MWNWMDTLASILTEKEKLGFRANIIGPATLIDDL